MGGEVFGKNCYSLLRHACDGRCQGCCDCPFAEAYHMGAPCGTVSRWHMLKYVVRMRYDSWRWHRWEKKHSAEIAEAVADALQQANGNTPE